MSSERADEPMTPDNPRGIPGRTLASQREAMGWTVEQVADQLKLQVRQVVALEAGDYAALPSPAVTRGFVRAYAKLMRLDPAPLVAQIAMESPAAPEPGVPLARHFSESKFPSHGKRKSLPLGWIAGAVVVAAAAAAAWHFGLVPHRAAEAEGTPAPGAAAGTPADAAGASANGSAVETLQNPAVPLISVPGQNGTGSAPASGPAPAGNGAAPAANTPAAPAANTPAAPQPATPATPAQNAPAAPAGQAPGANAAPGTAPATAQPAAQTVPANSGANALVLNVREDSWIQVTPAKGGAPLISRLVKGGSTETVSVDQPVRMVVGNPDGVTATLRGNAVALPMLPGKKLSRINLQ